MDKKNGIDNNGSSPKSDSLKNQVKSNIGKEISDEEIKKNTDNIPVKNPFIRKNAMVISALISIVGCFLNFTKTTLSYGAKSVSGKSSIINIILNDTGAKATFFALIVFAVPIIIIIMNYIPALKKHRRKIALIGPAVGLIFEIILYNTIEESAGSVTSGTGIGFSTHLGLGGILIAAGFILTAVVGLFVYYGVKKDNFKK